MLASIALLCIVNGKRRPDWGKVQIFGQETAQMIEAEYKWYRPSPSIHALCLHAKDAFSDKCLPPGYWTEGSQESYNRQDRNTRHNHARRCSRKANITDTFNAHLAYGDPLISSKMRSKSENDFLEFPTEFNFLLTSSSPNEQDSIEERINEEEEGRMDDSDIGSLLLSDDESESDY